MTNVYDFCQLAFAGRLTKDPIFDSNKNGTEQAKFTIARSKVFFKGKDREDKSEIVTFLPCYAYGEYLLKKLRKVRKGYWVLVRADFCPLKNAKDEFTSVGFVIESINAIVPPKGHTEGEGNSEENVVSFAVPGIAGEEVENNSPF